jgi:hypothetical protein
LIEPHRGLMPVSTPVHVIQLTTGRTEMKALLNLVALAMVLGSTATAQADAPKAKSAELQVLDRYVGSWEENSVAKPALWTPEGAISTTTTTRRWILNGQMIENKGAWTPGNIEFLHLMTYDSNQKEYRQWYFDKGNLVPQTSQGKWDAATQTFTFLGTLGDGIQSTSQQRFVDKDTFTPASGFLRAHCCVTSRDCPFHSNV